LPDLGVRGVESQPEVITAPTAIRVIHDRRNTCRPSVPIGQVDLVDFETYVKRVVPAEVYTSWEPAALQAQAIAARTYAWYQVLHPGNHPDYDVTDSTADQLMCNNQYASTDAAVDATRGQSIQYRDNQNRLQIAFAQFSAQNGNITVANSDISYLQAVPDPVGIGKTRRGHGHGLSQEGAQAWAKQFGWNDLQILAHYYTSATVQLPSTGSPQSGPLSSVVEPWNGWYLNGGVVLLKALATSASSTVNRVDFQIAYQGGSGVVNQTLPASAVGDTWQATWDYHSLGDLGPIGTLQIRSMATDAAGNTSTGSEIRVGVDRAAPTGALHTPGSQIETITATLGVAGSDSGPSDLLGYGFSNGWQWEGEGQAITHDPNSGYTTQDLPASRPGGRFQVRTRLDGGPARARPICSAVARIAPCTVCAPRRLLTPA